MSKTIYKYTVPVNGLRHEFNLARPAEIVRVACQHERSDLLHFWAVVDPVAAVLDTRRRYFTVVGTGDTWPTGARYIGSGEVASGVLVWHLLELDQ